MTQRSAICLPLGRFEHRRAPGIPRHLYGTLEGDPPCALERLRHRHIADLGGGANPRNGLPGQDPGSLLAEGRSNSAIAEQLTVTLKTVESRIASIFSKLGLHGAHDDHRRVLAVLAALRAPGGQPHSRL